MFKIGHEDFRWRGLEACRLAFFLCLLFAPGALAQKPPVSPMAVKQTARQSLTLIKPSDPLFDGMIDSYFPGLSSEAGYQASIKPLLVIVRNDTTRPAIAYAVTWAAPNPPGWISPLSAMFINTALTFREAMTYLPPGGIRLLSPRFNVTPKEYAAAPSLVDTFTATQFPSMQGVASVDAEVDGVVYSGGSFIGPDKTRILQRYVMARFAARDESLAVLNLIKTSTGAQFVVAQQLLQTLDQEIQRDGRARHRTLLALYVGQRGHSARDIRRILRDRGLSGLETRLKSWVGRPGGNAQPSTFDRAYQKLSNKDPRVFGFTP